LRSLLDLLSDDTAWPLVEQWVARANKPVRVLPADRPRGEEALQRLQVTTHSVLGALAFHTAGLLVDHGWLRLLGSGATDFAGLTSWNWDGEAVNADPLKDALLVAHDALGGFFAIDGGGMKGTLGDVFYLAPDTLRWESLELGHSDFIRWALTGDVARFYEHLRWVDWEPDVATLSADEGFFFYPLLVTGESRPLEKTQRTIVQMPELWRAHRDLSNQLAELPDGASIRVVVDDRE
jgi:hypothetical protein